MSIVDDFLRKLWIHLLKTKDNTFEKFKHWRNLVENQTEKEVEKLRKNNGLESLSKEFIKLCDDEGIARDKTMVGTLQ